MRKFIVSFILIIVVSFAEFTKLNSAERIESDHALSGRSKATLLSENFNASTSLPAGWTIVDHQGNGQVWEFGILAGGLVGTDGNFAFLNSDGYGSGNSQNTDLVSPKIDLTNYTDVNLAFMHFFRELTGTSGTLSYSIDGGSNWVVIRTWTASTLNPKLYSQIIPELAGQSNVKIKWNYTGTYGYYWCFDDLLITASTSIVPDITLSTALLSTTTIVDGIDIDSFNIGNIGDGTLNYDISFDYTSKGNKADVTVHSNDFNSGLGTYITSGNILWEGSGSQAVLNAPSGGSPNGSEVSTLESDIFDGTGCTDLTLFFDQNFISGGQSSVTVEYFDGGIWAQIYSASNSTSTSQSITLPNIASTMQLRFTGNMKNKSGDSWTIDNVVVSGPEVVLFSWLNIDSPISGTVEPSGSNKINITCDAAGLAEGIYTADIIIDSNDPDELSKILPVEFTVTAGSAISSPANVYTVSVSQTEVDLSWDSVSGAAVYYIYRSTEPYSGFVNIGSSAVTSYQDTDVSTGNKYFYYITADNVKK